MQPSIFAILQARMASSRLTGKVLLDIAGQPMLVRVVERTRRAKTLNGVIVATTTDPSDDALESLCNERGYPCYRGSMHDVLDRYYQAACAYHAEVIVRITADCPLMDADLIDDAVEVLTGIGSSEPGMANSNLQSAICNLQLDFVANRLPPPWSRTYPIGLDVEVCTFAALERAWQEADQPFQREHVMPYFYEGIPPEALQPPSNLQSAIRSPQSAIQNPQSAICNLQSVLSPRGFRVAQLHHHPDYGHLRWTVDTPADLELVRQVFARFPGREAFSWLEVLALFEREPQLAQINADVPHKTAFDVDERRQSAIRNPKSKI